MERTVGNESGAVGFDDIAYLIDAFREGKGLETSLVDTESWIDLDCFGGKPAFNFKELKYRVKQNWYDNIPEHGVLCWVSEISSGSKEEVEIITRYDKSKGYNFIAKDDEPWPYATPLTDDEIKQFLRGE